MGTVPFNFGGNTPSPIFAPFGNNTSSPFEFGNLPFNANPVGGMNNGLNLSGAWASGGFNTTGQPSSSGYNSFYGTGTNTPTNSSSLFGVPTNQFPAFGTPSVGGSTVPFNGMPATSPGANNNFGFNPSTGLPTIGGPGLGVQSANQGPFPQIDTNQLKKLYGNAIGGALTQFLNSGAGYNPQVVQALINQAMPLEAKGNARLMSDFGNTGNAYSSTAALGIGDFESQFNSALSGQMAQLYEQSVQNYIQVLESTMGAAQAGKAQAITPMSILSELGGGALAGLSSSNKGNDPFTAILAGLGAL